MTGYPPVPWRMAGPAVVGIGPMPAGRARTLVPAGADPLILGGRGIGVLLAADYRLGDGLHYGETAALVAVRRPVLGGFVAAMLVDSEASRAGGREMWNVPKELCRFAWERDPPAGVTISDADGRAILTARWRPVRPRISLPSATAFLGGLDGTLVPGLVKGRAGLVPWPVRFDVPRQSPLAVLEMRRPWITLAGHVDALASGGRPAPR